MKIDGSFIMLAVTSAGLFAYYPQLEFAIPRAVDVQDSGAYGRSGCAGKKTRILSKLQGDTVSM